MTRHFKVGVLTLVIVCACLQAVVDRLRGEHFDASVGDLIHSECTLALLKDMDVPSKEKLSFNSLYNNNCRAVVGFWAASAVGGIHQHTALPFNPTYVPTYRSAMGEKMDFWQRRRNLYLSLDHLKSSVSRLTNAVRAIDWD